jgi:hypothetical protein
VLRRFSSPAWWDSRKHAVRKCQNIGGEAARLKAELTRLMHEPTAQVGEWLKRAVEGYYQYHAVPGNLNQLSAFRHRRNTGKPRGLPACGQGWKLRWGATGSLVFDRR